MPSDREEVVDLAAKKKAVISVFTGRNVALSEISQASGIGIATIKHGLRDGVLDFGYAIPCGESNQYRYYCPDKLVYEKIGYVSSNEEV